MNFTQTFSEVPVCVPARRVMMTGKNRYGIHMNVNVDGQPFPEGPKLAEVMTAAGYQTFAAGKLHTCGGSRAVFSKTTTKHSSTIMAMAILPTPTGWATTSTACD